MDNSIRVGIVEAKGGRGGWMHIITLEVKVGVLVRIECFMVVRAMCRI